MDDREAGYAGLVTHAAEWFKVDALRSVLLKEAQYFVNLLIATGHDTGGDGEHVRDR